MEIKLPHALTAKMALLEQSIGLWKGKPFTPPRDFRYSDAVEVQQVAKQMASSVGLGDLVFIVTYAKQGSGVAGHIELRHAQPEVFVEIDNALECQESVLAVLAHEIAHKFLHRKGVSLPVESENEELTDLATIFMGFGRLSLNGCEAGRPMSRLENGKYVDATVKSRVGYLGLKSFSEAYFLHSVAAGLSLSEWREGLSSHALQSVLQAELEHEWLFSMNNTKLVNYLPLDRPTWHKDFTLLASLVKRIQKEVAEALESFHRTEADLKRTAEELDRDTRKSLIQSAEFVSQVTEWNRKVQINAESQVAASFFKSIEWKQLSREDFAKSSKFLLSCPRCDAGLRVPNTVDEQTLRCPKCTLEFEFASPIHHISYARARERAIQVESSPSKKGWLRRILPSG